MAREGLDGEHLFVWVELAVGFNLFQVFAMALVGRQHMLGSAVKFELMSLAEVEELVEVVLL